MIQDELQMVERMASCGFTMIEAADVIERDIHVFDLPAYKLAYRKGFLKRQLELRERIFKDAKNGSSPAQALAKKIMDDCLTKMGGEI